MGRPDTAVSRALDVALIGTTVAVAGLGCGEELLEARAAQGRVVAGRTGACSSDTWSITGDGLPAAPRYTRERTPSNTVEVRLVLDPQQQKGSAIAWWRALPQTLELAATAGSAAGVSVHGPYLEDDELTMYLRGPGAASVLAFARSHVLRPAPLTASAYVSAPGEPAPQTATPVVLTITTASTTAS